MFTATDEEHGSELWITNGSLAGTRMIHDTHPGSIGSTGCVESNRVLLSETADDRVFFVADDGEHGCELWQTDGTSAGTKLVQDIVPGVQGSYPYSLTNVEGTIYFTADDGAEVELWSSDGTPEGTQVALAIMWMSSHTCQW